MTVFRDDTNLASTPALWPTIATALDASRHLVVLASPRAAQSYWVDREVAHFLSRQPARPVHIVLIDGTLVWNRDADTFDTERSDALVPALRSAFDAEPLIVELPARVGARRTLADGAFRRAIARLAAPIRGTTVEELDDTHRRLQRRDLGRARTAVALLAVLLVVAGIAGTLAFVNGQEARKQTNRAVSRFLAAQSTQLLGSNPELALLTAVHAARLEESVGSRSALLSAINYAAFVSGTARLNPSDALDEVTLRADGGAAVTAQDRQVQLWDIIDGRPVLRRRADIDQVRDIEFRTGDEIVLTGLDGEVVGWRLGADQRDTWRPGPEQLLLDRSGAFLAGEDAQHVLTVWDVATRRAIMSTPPLGAAANVIAVSTDRQRIALAADRQVTIFGLSDGRPLGPPVGLGSGYNRGIGFSSDLRLVAADVRQESDDPFLTNDTIQSNSTDPEGLVLVDLTSGERTAMPKSGGTATSVVFSPDDRTVVTGEESGRTGIYDVATRTRTASAVGHVGLIHAVSVEGGAPTTAASVETGGRLVIRELTDRKDFGEAPVADRPTPRPHTGPIADIDLGADGRRLLVASIGGLVRLSDPDNDSIAAFQPGSWSLTLPDAPLIGARLIDEGRSVAFTTPNGRLLVKDVDADPELAAEPELIGMVGSRSLLTAAGNLLATAGEESGVRLWRRDGDRWQATELGDPAAGDVTGLELSSDGRYLAVGRRNEEIEIWSVADRTRLDVIPPFSTRLLTTGRSPVVAFQPGGRLLASGRPDGTVVLWDLERRGPVGDPIKISDSSVVSVALSPDGRMLAVGQSDTDGIALLDVPNRRPVGTISGRLAEVTSLRFASDGMFLAAGDENGLVRIWDTAVESWQRRLCEVVNREISDGEWADLVGDVPRGTTCS